MLSLSPLSPKLLNKIMSQIKRDACEVGQAKEISFKDLLTASCMAALTLLFVRRETVLTTTVEYCWSLNHSPIEIDHPGLESRR